MVKVKICGITNLKDAKAAVDRGCDALGFVFYKKSPRYIAPQEAKEIIANLPKDAIKIGVFVNAGEKTIKDIAHFCGLDILQFHGNESVEFCQRFDNYKVIKAFKIKDKLDLPKILEYKTFAYSFDTFVKSKAGGTGKKFNWKLLKALKGIKKPIFLSGGINAKNVKDAIKTVHPDWVDVSSSLESSPGKKDHKKVREFIEAVKL
jgi:phosphoribosylanthranilate isomerase